MQTRKTMAQCVTCGSELHPERAEKYDYCTRRECREQNARPLTIAAVAVNKSADQYLVLNEQTREDLAAGRYQDQRKSASVTGVPPRQRPRTAPAATKPGPRPGVKPAPRPTRRTPAPPQPRRSWTKAQEDLALIYSGRGMRPDEIAERLGVSRYTATQMILAGKSRDRR
jgi:DNA-binding CsgD family transcriptional regulator